MKRETFELARQINMILSRNFGLIGKYEAPTNQYVNVVIKLKLCIIIILKYAVV